MTKTPLIPITQGERLFAAAPEPKQFYRMRGGHNDAFVRTGQTYYDVLGAFIAPARAIDPHRVLNHNGESGSPQ